MDVHNRHRNSNHAFHEFFIVFRVTPVTALLNFGQQ